MLVLAIAVLIFEHVGGGMRLVAAEAEGEADVANIFCDVIIERGDFFEFGGAALNQLLSLGADFRGGVAAAFFKIGVPFGDLCPRGERGELDVGHRFRGRLRFFLGLLGFGWAREIGVLPVVNFAIGGELSGLLDLRGGDELVYASGGQVDVEALIQNDRICYECVIEPEISGRERGDCARCDFIFDSVSGVE